MRAVILRMAIIKFLTLMDQKGQMRDGNQTPASLTIQTHAFLLPWMRREDVIWGIGPNLVHKLKRLVSNYLYIALVL